MSSGKLIMCKGLPASGKSRWSSNEQVRDASILVVTKDDIRAALNAKSWNYDVEKEVLRIRDTEISKALSKGQTVISADTNLAPKHEARLRGLATKYKATFEVKSFLDVDVNECIRRDLARKDDPDNHYVGEKVIMDMHNQFIVGGTPSPQVVVKKPIPQDVVGVPYVPNHSKQLAIICDLDGTIALHQGRSPFDTARAGEDKLNEPVATILRNLSYNKPYAMVLYVSGREEKFREVTQRWLDDVGVPDGILLMRPTGDTRNDAVVKLEIFNRDIRDNYNVLFVLDDRDRVVKMWRGLGLTCLQVNYGDF